MKLVQEKKKRVTLYVTKEHHKLLKKEAVKRETSATQLIHELLQERYEK